MPLYSINGPDGRLYQIEGPPNATREQVIDAVQHRLSMQESVQRAQLSVEPTVERSKLRETADIPLKVSEGVVAGVRMIADAFGANNPVSKNLRSVENYIADLYSAQSKADSKRIAEIMKEAEDKGVVDNLRAAWDAFKVAPVDLLTNALGTAAPTILGGLGAGALRLGAVGVRGTQLGLGAATGAGVTKGAIYDAVKQELTNSGMPADQIEARAQLAQQYQGENLDQILAGTALGGLAATTGLESKFLPGITNKILSRAASTEGRGVFKEAAVAGVKEAIPEALQGGQEQLAQNVALQREGFDVPTMRGVVGAGALEGLAGFGVGAPLGGISQSRALGAQEQQRVAEEARVEQELAPINAERQRIAGIAATAQQEAVARQQAEQAELAAQEQARQAFEASLRVPLTQQTELDLAPETTIEEVAAQRAAQSPQGDLFAEPVAPVAEAEPTLDDDTIKSFGFKKNSLAYKAMAALNNTAIAPAEQVKRFDQIIENNQDKIKSTEQEEAINKFKTFMDQRIEKERVNELRTIDTGAVGESPDLFGGPVTGEPTGGVGESIGTGVDGVGTGVGAAEVGTDAGPVALEEEPFVPNEAWIQRAKAAENNFDTVQAQYNQVLSDPNATPEQIAEVTTEFDAANRQLQRAQFAENPVEAPAVPRMTAEERQQRIIEQRAEEEAARKAEREANLAKTKAFEAGRRNEELAPVSEMPEARREGLQAAREFEETPDVDSFERSVIPMDDIPVNIENAIAAYKAEVDQAKKQLSSVKLLNNTFGDETTAAGVVKAQKALDEATNRLDSAYKHFQSLPAITKKLEQRQYSQAIKDIKDQGFVDEYGFSLLKAIENNKPKEALKLIATESKAPHLRLVASMLLKSKTFPFTSFYDFGKGEEATRGGYSAANDFVSMDAGTFLQRAFTQQAKDMDRVFIHEMIHSATVNTLSGGYRVSEVSNVLNEAFLTSGQKADLKYKESAENIIKLFDYLATIDGLKEQYGMTNPFELLSEAFTNPSFQKTLKDIKVPTNLGITQAKPSIWDTFINSLKQLLGIEATPDSALAKVLSEGANLIAQRSTFNTKVKGTPSQLKGRDSIREKYGSDGDIERSVSTEPTGENIKRDLMSSRVRDARLNLGALVSKITPKLLSMYQLVDQFGTSGRDGKFGKALTEYVNLNDRMTMEQQKLKQAAHALLMDWGQFAKQQDAMAKRLNTLMQEATRSRIHPDEAFDAEPNAHLTEEDRIKHEELSNAYATLSPEAKQIYQRARQMLQDNFRLRSTRYRQMVQDSFAEELANADEAGKKRVEAKMEKAIKEHEMILNEMRGPYFPLMRFGEFLVVAESNELSELRERLDELRDLPDGLTEEDKAERSKIIGLMQQMEKSEDHYSVYAFEKRSQQAQKANELINKGMNVRETKSEEYMNSLRASTFGAIDQLEKIFDRDLDLGLSKEQASRLRQSMIDSVLAGLPENSALQRQIKRRNIAGATDNMLRAFAETMERDSHYISRMGFMKPLSKSLIDMRNQTKADNQLRDIYNNVRERLNLDMKYDNHPILSKITSISSIYHLGVAPSYLLQNMTQPFMITLPQLAGRYGAAKTSKAIISAWKDSIKAIRGGRDGKFASLKDTDLSKADLTSGELKMVQLLQDLGKLDIANNMDTEVYTKGMSPRMIKFWNMFNWSSHNIELMNRLSSALAAYRLEKGRGGSEEAATKAARDAVELTQLDYSDTNAAYFMKQGHMGGLNRIPMQFRKYQQGMIYLLARNFKNAWGGDKEARSAFFYLMGTQLLMAGVRGVPVAAPLLFLMGAFGDDDDKEGDLETQLRNALADAVGPETARMFWKGLPAMMGLDSGSMSMENLFLPFPMMRSSAITDAATGKDAVTELMFNLGGAPVSMASRIGDAFILGSEGDYQKALEKALPKFMSSLIKAERLGDEGITTRSGNVAIEGEEFSAWDQAIKAMGFTPAKESEYYQAMYEKERITRAIDDRRNRIIKAIATSRLNGEIDQDAMQQAKEFNSEHPSRRITGESITRSVAQRRKDKQQRNEAGVRFQKRERDIQDVTRFAN